MQDVYIIGVGMNRFGKHKDDTVSTMAVDVITKALEDAKLAKKDIEAAYFSNSFWGLFDGQHSIWGKDIFRGTRFDNISPVNVLDACAGA